jgi:alpha-beta hydrolase superfamily lysophospholipase
VHRAVVIVVGAAALVAAACSDSGSSASIASTPPAATTAAPSAPAASTEAPSSPSTAAPAARPGDIVSAQPFPGPAGSQGYQVLYVSTTVDNTPVTVSGVVIVPGAGAPAAPPEGRPVLSWAHGTTGLGDACAPSAQYPTGRTAEVMLAQLAVGRGMVYAATDYQGLGTPGPHPYSVGLSEGRNVLDIARAAQRLTGSGAGPTSKVLVWGHSQGGGAAAFSAELAPTYAPDLAVLGAIVGAPAADFPVVSAAIDGGLYFGFAVMAAAGFKAAYPQLSYDAVLNDAGKQAVASIADACSDQVLKQFGGHHASEYQITSPQEAPGWKDAVAANEPGQMKTPVPIFLYQGQGDQVIPVQASAELLQRYCALGVTAERKTYPGTDHTSVIPAALGDIVAFANDRLAGLPAPSSCGS